MDVVERCEEIRLKLPLAVVGHGDGIMAAILVLAEVMQDTPATHVHLHLPGDYAITYKTHRIATTDPPPMEAT